MTSPGARLERILANPPPLHGETTYSLLSAALRWIASLPRPLHTLETGCGLSTIVFALRDDDHVCITPYGTEPEAVQRYCAQEGIGTGTVTFLVHPSELVLPSLEIVPRDVVLIDGSHAFPHVFIDYFYAARLLRVGGTMIIDDVHLWTGNVLRHFMLSEPEWELMIVWDGRTVAFRKNVELTSRDWFDQPFVSARSTPWRARARMAASMLRKRDFATLARYARALVGHDAA